MNSVDNNIKQTQLRQGDILSPVYFQSAVDYLKQARDGRNKNLEQATILHNIALAQAYLNKANNITDIANPLLANTIKERQNSLIAKADKFFPESFAIADKKLKIETKKIENNDTSGAEKNNANLEEIYNHLELISIKKAKMGQAQENLQTAVNEGASTLTPETFVWAQEKMNATERVIEANRHESSKRRLSPPSPHTTVRTDPYTAVYAMFRNLIQFS